jgi:hypothetical protein
MQKVSDDLTKALNCVAEASKQVEMAVLHMRSSETLPEITKEEIALRQRCSGFLYAVLASMGTVGRVMSIEQGDLLALVPDPVPGAGGKIHKM